MPVETPDPRTGRWVLYASEHEHSQDAAAHPFELIPRRVFLDTSTINTLVRFAGQIFEHAEIDRSLDSMLAEDVESLMHVFTVGARADWDLVSSSAMLEELEQTPCQATREILLEYGVGLVSLPSERLDAEALRRFSSGVEWTGLFRALPDAADRALLCHAIVMGCDAFCTRDRATILSKRSRLPRLPLRVLSPREWWSTIRPWAGLWC